MKKVSTLTMLFIFIYTLSIQSFAAEPIKIVVNGKTVSCEPSAFERNGTTFIPLRFISEALGIAVNYDRSENAIYIGEPPEGRYIEPFRSDGLFKKDPPMIFGTRYTQGAWVGSIDSEQAGWNLKRKFRTFTFSTGCSDGSSIAKFIVFGDGKELLIVPRIKASDGLKEFIVDVTGVEILSIVKSDVGISAIPIINPTFK